MSIKVIAQRRLLKIGKTPSKRFVMRPDLYSSIAEKKVFTEASTHSGISAGVIKAAWEAAGAVIRTWATEGHSVPVPGLGTMRFGVRAKAVEKLDEVKTGLITTRRIVFTPSVDVKDDEVDIVIESNKQLIAIEVKSGHRTTNKGLPLFYKQFKPVQSIVVGSGGVPIEEFLTWDIGKLLE